MTFLWFIVILAILPPPGPPRVSSAQTERAAPPYVKFRDSSTFFASLFPNTIHTSTPPPPASFLNKPLQLSEQHLGSSCRDTIFVLSLPVASRMAAGEGVLGNSHATFLLASLFLSGHSPLILSCSLLSTHFVCLFLSKSIKMKKAHS